MSSKFSPDFYAKLDIWSIYRKINLDTNLFYIFFYSVSYFKEVKELSWTSNLSRKTIINIINLLHF